LLIDSILILGEQFFARPNIASEINWFLLILRTWRNRGKCGTGFTHIPAIVRRDETAYPVTTQGTGINSFRSVKHGESYYQDQNCKEKGKDSELSEKLHLISPPCGFKNLAFPAAIE
jgi:hypothetical protein